MRRFRPALWPTLFTVPVLAVSLALGWWQLERREWKHDLLSKLEARLSAEPVTVEPAVALPAHAEFRRITLTGRFLHDAELHYPGRTLDGRVGFEIMTPLVLEDGGHVALVDRGWVPQEGGKPAMASSGRPEGTVAVEGAVRLPPEPGWFTPENAVDRNQWYSVDLAAAARAAGVEPERMLPFYVVAAPTEAEGRLPVARGTRIDLPDNHLGYAITWFSLAAVLLAIYVLYHVRRSGDS